MSRVPCHGPSVVTPRMRLGVISGINYLSVQFVLDNGIALGILLQPRLLYYINSEIAVHLTV